MGFEFQTRTALHKGMTSIALSGELDMETAPILQEVLTQVEGSGTSTIVLDLQDLAFIDSTGLLACLRARDRAELKGYQLTLSDANAAARRLFEITKTEFLLDERSETPRGDASGTTRGQP